MPNKVTTSKQLSFIFSRLILFSEPAEGLKIWGLSIYVVSIICSPGWNRANSSAKIWWGEANALPLPPPSIPTALLYNIEVPWGRRKVYKRTLQRESDELSENLVVGSAYLANRCPTLESGIKASPIVINC